MNSKKLSYLVAIVALLMVYACKKSETGTVKTITPPVITPVSTSDPDADIYFAGTSTGPAPTNFQLATYWKNGAVNVLADSLSNLNSEADAIAVKGSDIYIAGATHIGVFNVATRWKNGLVKQLASSSASSQALAVEVSGTDVYIAGNATAANGSEVATYWKNDIPNMLPGSLSEATSANAIAVSGSDIYMAGYTFNFITKGYYEATYWKNGIATKLSNNPSGSQLFAIVINNSDVYVAGYVAGIATLWKNGTVITLANNTLGSIAKALVISGADLYAAGYTGNKAAYWKNGVTTMLTGTISFADGALANVIAVNGANVYVAGGINAAGYLMYWKNGTAIQLSKNFGAINGIAVLPK